MNKRNKVLVGGCFDLFHYGHLLFLKKARALGEYLVVALEADEFIRKHKQREPIHTQAERAAILRSLRVVDEVLELPSSQTAIDYLKIVKEIQPTVIAVTLGDPQFANKQQQAAAVGAKIVTVTPLIANFSTSSIIARLSE